MKIFSDKKKLIQRLFVLAFIFLLANIIVGKFVSKHYTPIETARTADFINAKFLVALKNYGIQDAWIKREKRSRKDDDSLLYKYKVEVPKDLPAALLIDEVEDSLGVDGVVIRSNELKIGGATQMKIFSGDNLKLQAVFNYDENIQRDAGSVGIIINDATQLSSENYMKLLRLPERFSILLSPSKSTVKLQDQITSAQKEICVLISDENTDLDYKMKSDFSPDRIRNSISAIISDYSSAAFFVLDNRSGFYSSPAMGIIKNILNKARIKYINLTDCGLLNSSGEIKNQFEVFVKNSKTKNHSILRVTPDELTSLIPELVKFRKVGYKFVRPSVLL